MLNKLGVAALIIFAAELAAQNFTGSLRGTVEDSTGSRLASARVTIREHDASAERTIVCDGHGEFRIDGLLSAEYQLLVLSSGFSNATASVLVAVSATRDIRVTMKPLVAPEFVGVSAVTSSVTAQPIDSASQIHQTIVTRQDLENLPLAQRSFANIAYLAPGTEPVEPSDPTKARITAVSTGGSSGLNNELTVDGADDTDDYIGGFLQGFSPDSIHEFSVSTAQEDADTGGTTAGSVVIVTRRGGEEWHGNASFYERDAALNARYALENPAPEPKQSYSRQDFAGTVGGPLWPKKLWVFDAFEAVHEDASVAYSSASIGQFSALAGLASKGLIAGVDSIAVPSIVPVPFRDYSESVRLDWAQSSNSSWFMRASGDRYSTRNNLIQQATLPSTGLLTRNAYWNLVVGNQFLINSKTIGSLVLSGGSLHLTQTRNSNYGFALAFPFSSTALTTSGFETFGDNQFATPVTFFPSLRNQQKYQLRYDLTREAGHHTLKFGVNFIHEPVLSGAFPSNPETLYQLPQNPTYYVANPSQFAVDLEAGASSSQLGGGFAQNVQRLALYAQDSWLATSNLTLNFGFRYSSSFGLFESSGRTQVDNPAYITLHALAIQVADRPPVDDQKQLGPRLGFAYSPGRKGINVIRGGIGLYFNDLAQSGWATAFQAVNTPPGQCVNPLDATDGRNAGCIQGHASGGTGNVIAPNYQTPYAIHITAGFQRALSANGVLSIDYTHEQGNHGYRAYGYQGGINLFTPLLSVSDPNQAQVVPDINAFHSDNRSSYDALLLHLQDNLGSRASLVANYTLSTAQTWGCVLGELFDYVNGVCDPTHPFAPGDYGPSGEDVRHRFVLAGFWHAQKGFQVSVLAQAESARPFTITTADGANRISILGTRTSLDQFRGTPYVQTDLRVARQFKAGDRLTFVPFLDCFNVSNRTNPGANYVTNIASLPVPSDEAQSGNITDVCANADCTAQTPIASVNKLRVAAGALGDFFGPGTTVGIPFAAQIGLRIDF